MEQSIYHSILRTSALSLSLALLFVSGVISPVTKELSQNTTTYVASAIGMYAAVEPNGINEVTAALTQKETELDAREAALRERELSVSVGGVASESPDYATFILSVVVFILLVLMVVNYVLDYLRATPAVRPVRNGSSV